MTSDVRQFYINEAGFPDFDVFQVLWVDLHGLWRLGVFQTLYGDVVKILYAFRSVVAFVPGRSYCGNISYVFVIVDGVEYQHASERLEYGKVGIRRTRIFGYVVFLEIFFIL